MASPWHLPGLRSQGGVKFPTGGIWRVVSRPVAKSPRAPCGLRPQGSADLV